MKELLKNLSPFGSMLNDEEHLENPNVFFSLLGWVITIIAIYLAFKCIKPKSLGDIDGNGFMNLIAALCCSPCYIAYRLAVPC